MTLQDVLQDAKALSNADRRKLIKILVDTLTTNESDTQGVEPEPSVETLLNPAIVYDFWSPHDSFKAAQQSQELLDEYKRNHVGS